MAKITCIKCEKEKRDRDFYLSRSDLYSVNKKIPICSKCLGDRYEKVLGIYGDYILALQHCCYNFDIFFDQELAEALDEKSINEYIDKLNKNAKYRKKTSLNNMIEKKSLIDLQEEGSEISEKNVKLIRKWGEGYTENEYFILEEKEKEYLENYEPESLTEKKILRELSMLEVERDKARMEGNRRELKDLSELLSKKMGDANIKPNQKKILGEADDDIFGMILKIYETEEPIPEPLEEFKDVNNFLKYLNKIMVRPFARALGLASGDYSLDEEDKNIVMDDKLLKEFEEFGEVDSDDSN
jgi:hypothetical protein